MMILVMQIRKVMGEIMDESVSILWKIQGRQMIGKEKRCYLY